MEATLLLCGERGYAQMSTLEVIKRAGESRKTFYELYESKEECFLRAHDAGMEQLARQVLQPARAASDWCAGVRAGLTAAVELVEEQPTIARCLLIEASAAGRRTMAKRAEVLRRFGNELDRVRRQIPSAAKLPPLASEIVVGGLESQLRMHLQTGDPPKLQELLPELAYFAINPYLGHKVATEQWRLMKGARDG